VFFLGDLNYRLTDITTPEIQALLDQFDVERLAEHDQLRIEKDKGQIFMDFYEGQLAFFPTYKYCKGTNTYDIKAKSAKKKRDPAWCDRILFRGDVVQLSYNACSSVMTSDHKPVYAEFRVEVKRCDKVLKATLLQSIQDKLDALHGDSLPNEL
jgi:phosphatidylinositol-bisphosphatase